MKVNELCSKYQKKMWLSMISRLKLDIDVWDLVRYSHDLVYASKNSVGNSEYIVDTDRCLVCDTKFGLKLSKEYFFIDKKCNCANDNGFNWTKDKLKCLFSSEQKINSLIGAINDKKTSKFPGRTKFWLDMGVGDEEAKNKVSEWQKKQSKKSSATKPGSRSHSIRCFEFYIDRGFTEEEARASVRNIQITNGIDWYIKKYGEELGEILFKDRIDRWLTTYYSKIDIDEVNKSKGRTKKQIIDNRGLEWYNEYEIARRAKIIQTKIAKGQYTSSADKEEKIIYLEKVSFFTRYSIRNHFDVINPLNEPIGIRDYHIDHLFSKNMGFLENIAPEIIGNPLNLRAIYWRDNLSKGSKSIITKEQLYKNYEKSKFTNRYPY